ncbi:MAG: hypothetical protein JRE64_14940 [Deltaproteobacteria bacterium]|nr:hypothetical protein [Deltaproteobacteria bacterium]
MRFEEEFSECGLDTEEYSDLAPGDFKVVRDKSFFHHPKDLSPKHSGYKTALFIFIQRSVGFFSFFPSILRTGIAPISELVIIT